MIENLKMRGFDLFMQRENIKNALSKVEQELQTVVDLLNSSCPDPTPKETIDEEVVADGQDS
jgi:hypothetical protein